MGPQTSYNCANIFSAAKTGFNDQEYAKPQEKSD